MNAYDGTKERGWILRILERTYPDPLDQDTLRKQLIDLKFVTSQLDIRGYIAYLQEKELIRVQTVGTGYLQRTVVYLTAYGKDLLEGRVLPIVGIDV